MQDNRKSANRNTESTLSHRHHSLNLVHPSSCGLCTQERDEDGGGGDGGSGCICDFYRSVTPHPANSPEPRQRAFLLCPVSLLFDFWILEACQVPTYLSIRHSNNTLKRTASLQATNRHKPMSRDLSSWGLRKARSRFQKSRNDQGILRGDIHDSNGCNIGPRIASRLLQ
jgi:hypothetical protein